jgi:hypothetical protein
VLPASQRDVATDVHHVEGKGPHHDNSDRVLRQMSHAHHSRVTAREQSGWGAPPVSSAEAIRARLRARGLPVREVAR